MNGLLFVTVGNGRFDPLVQKLDQLKSAGRIDQEVVLQIGHGRYKPRHCRWFTFDPDLEQYYQQADLVISHGGPGTVFEILRLGKKMIALPNRDRTDPRHQVEYLEAMAAETTALLYCPTVEKIEMFIKKAKTHHFSGYQPPLCTMHTVVKSFLQ